MVLKFLCHFLRLSNDTNGRLAEVELGFQNYWSNIYSLEMPLLYQVINLVQYIFMIREPALLFRNYIRVVVFSAGNQVQQRVLAIGHVTLGSSCHPYSDDRSSMQDKFVVPLPKSLINKIRTLSATLLNIAAIE